MVRVCVVCNDVGGLESVCCNSIYCWGCVEGKQFSCKICKQPLSSNSFQLADDTVRVNRSDVPKARKEFCPQGCGLQVDRSDLNQHFERDCPKWNVNCHQCLALVQRGQLNNHMQQTCIKLPINCKYSNVGCNVKVMSSDMDSHLKDYAVAHTQMMLDAFKINNNEGLSRRNTSTFNPSAPPMDNPQNPLYPNLNNIHYNNHRNVNDNNNDMRTNIRNLYGNLEEVAQSYFQQGVNFISNFNLNNVSSIDTIIRTGWSGLPPVAKLCIVLSLFFLFRPLLFFFRLAILFFVCFATYRYITTIPSYSASASSRSLHIGFFVFLVLYLTSALL